MKSWLTLMNCSPRVKPGLFWTPAALRFANLLIKEDFDDDTKDGGEIGSGQTVTVLYEIVPVSSEYEIPENFSSPPS